MQNHIKSKIFIFTFYKKDLSSFISKSNLHPCYFLLQQKCTTVNPWTMPYWTLRKHIKNGKQNQIANILQKGVNPWLDPPEREGDDSKDESNGIRSLSASLGVLVSSNQHLWWVFFTEVIIKDDKDTSFFENTSKVNVWLVKLAFFLYVPLIAKPTEIFFVNGFFGSLFQFFSI